MVAHPAFRAATLCLAMSGIDRLTALGSARGAGRPGVGIAKRAEGESDQFAGFDCGREGTHVCLPFMQGCTLVSQPISIVSGVCAVV